MPDEIINRLREENWQLQKDNAQLWATIKTYANRVSELKASLKETLEIASRNKAGDYQQRAAAALKETE